MRRLPHAAVLDAEEESLARLLALNLARAATQGTAAPSSAGDATDD